MAIKGAQKPVSHTLRPILGMRYYYTTAGGKRAPMLTILVPAKDPSKVYMHKMPVYTRAQDSEFSLFHRAVLGKFPPADASARDLCAALASHIVEHNGGIGFKEVVSLDGGKHRRWTAIEFVDLGDRHPGAGVWPECAIPGEDLFACDGSDDAHCGHTLDLLSEEGTADPRMPDLSDL